MGITIHFAIRVAEQTGIDTILDVATTFADARGWRHQRFDDDDIQRTRYQDGDRVRARDMHPRTHTRLPRYARGKAGVVERVHGAHVLPDTNAHGAGEHPQWLYSVRFAATELWGDDADPSLTVAVDAWESYLRDPDE